MMRRCRLMQLLLFICNLKIFLCYVNLADIECGIDSTRQSRIVGGSDSLPSEFPWTASIWRQGAHQCGATVLTDRWLMTAGHCICSVYNEFFQSKQLSAVVGYTDLGDKTEIEPISKLLPHPDYRCNKKTNDVALLMTRRQLKWTKDLKPACLPVPLAEDFSGTIATVTGWGFTDEDREKGSRPNILQKTDVLVVANEECNRWYRSQGSKVKITDTQLCAGYENGGKDSCWADSGGPLLIHEKTGRAMVVGVVSTGSGCARPKMPGIYTRVSQYTNWIQSIILETQRAKIRQRSTWYPN